MTILEDIKNMRVAPVPESKGLICWLLNIIPGVGSIYAGRIADDRNMMVIGIIQLVSFLLFCWCPAVSLIFVWSLFTGYLIWNQSRL